MTIPAYAVKGEAQTITGKIGDTEVKFEFAANANEATAEFGLADTQKLTFASIPAGTTVDITETLSTSTIQNQALYTQQLNNLTALADEDQTAPADTTIAGKDLKATTGSLDAATAAVVTNNLDDTQIQPEGILISNLPYIALALVAIGGLVAYVVIRRRNADEA